MDHWKQSLNMPKLKLYQDIKESFQTSEYVKHVRNIRNRSLFARLVFGCLDIEIEIGRWHGVSHEHRICKLCKHDVEDELHFLFDCISLRPSRLLHSIYFPFLNNCNISSIDKYKILFTECDPKPVSIFIRCLYDTRKSLLYVHK